uniref:Cadherin domain-containing protein n=1 Tax=Mesocestoides corti TaxID=53468 RepID=A0A5K3FHZ7_MESCO
MIGRSVHHLLIFILPLLTSAEHGTNQRTASFEMQEETELNTTIGSLRENLSPYPGSKVAFMYSGDFFRIDCHTGEVKVAVVLDRETVCQEHKICCGVIDCTLVDKVYLVYAESRDYIATILLKVDLTDINDNRPVFGSHLQRVNILENSEVGRYIGLRSATDADVNPKNQVNRYQWIEPTGTFILDQNNLPSIRLRLNSPVDREMRANYSGTLSACDIDSCTTTDVFIEVEDVNDNSPQFYKRHYRLESPESLTVGSTILRLNATDADSGDNAKIVYSFREPVDPDLADTFEIIANSGELRLRRPLDAKIRSSYNFKVVACDSVASECAGNDASSADIEVVVKDVNDNRPVIEIIPAGDYTSSTGDLVVQENFPAGQIAVVKVKDADIGENSRTACELDDHTSPSVFDLSQSAPDLYFLRTMRSFDFEQESVLTTTIRCRDFGTPPLSSVRTLTLRVLDVNEYAPEFHQRVFSTSVRENSQPGVDIITLSAIDRDGQSELRYKLAPPPLQHAEGEDIYSTAVSPSSTNSVETMGVNVHFDLDPKTGVLRTSRVQLDREVIERITLVVTVTDSSTPPIFTATATVSIEVLDENDNSPVFLSPPANMGFPFHQNDIQSYAFTVRENAPRYTRLSGRLEARDPDAGRNGQLHFSLRSVWALKGASGSYRHPGSGFNDMRSTPGRQLVEQRVFQITPDNGIETLIEFDREQVGMYLVDVAVRDNGTQPLATSTSLLVLILDENDNAPVWTFPADSSRQINITTADLPGTLVARLQAFDIDADEAGKVEFQVLDPNGQPMPPVTLSRGLYNSPPTTPLPNSPSVQGELMGYRTGPFYLNGSTGEILVADRLVPVSLKIRLRAIDSGQAQRLYTDTWMIINVKMDPNEFGGFLGGGRAGALNVTIILVMIAVTAIISLLLIIAIVCVRRKPARAVINNGASAETDFAGGGRVVACSPGSPFLISDPGKEALAANTWTESSKDFYPAGPGSLIIDENGQVVSSGALPYGSPLMGGGSDKTSVRCGMPPQGSLYTPVDMSEDMAGGVLAMHTFGTMSRGHRPGGVLGSVHGSSTGIRMGGSMQYEPPPLDADSGDSGRGPSEDGNQLMMLENQRMFSPHPGFQYGTCTGFRSSSRASYGLRSASAMGAPAGVGSGAIPRPYMQNPHGNGDNCSCYVEDHFPSSSTGYTDYVDSGTHYPHASLQQSPLGSYRTFFSGSQPSPGPRRFTPGGGETTISASIGSLPRSRAPSRSTVTFQSPSVVEGGQQLIKLDLRGPGETDGGEGAFATLPPRPVPRTITNTDVSG